jgi:L,D-peptidoglycan transpeptidase YkuD (ErfK/YbiS/YcfS/YnhG family)
VTRRAIAGLCLLAIGLAVHPGGGTAARSACPPTLANQLADTGPATQLITVTASTSRSTVASLRRWEKRGECWLAPGPAWTAHVGRNGVSAQKHEGDKRTPAGAFAIQTVMYGVGPNPGVRYSYRRVVCGDWWVEDPGSPFYNRFHHVRCGSKPPFRITSEDMSRSPVSYRHLAVIDYNTHPIVPGRGSGIFLHVSASGGPTLGCVSLPYNELVTTLRWLSPAAKPLIVIGTAATIRGYRAQPRSRPSSS